jgi:hypothetical protein
MKFANYVFKARGVNNLGDNMQIIAIDAIYEKMGLDAGDIVYIDKNDLLNYNGDYVVLPVTMPLIDYTERGMAGRFSPHIIPVFLGLTLAKNSLLPEEVAYYSNFQPIGCRDERTMLTLRRYGIICYLHGCITATLPRREIASGGLQPDKVFIVDPPKELLPYIPRELMEKAVFCTHMHENLATDPKAMMFEYYERYKNEASLIITSLLHCSVPCMAAGIPVVLAKTQVSYRFGWLEKLLPIYTQEEFSSIDWEPRPAAYEAYKEKVLELTIHRLWDTFHRYEPFFDISTFYEDRMKKNYIVDAFSSIKQYVDMQMSDPDKEYQYSIWGLTQMSDLLVDYIAQKCPRARLMHVYDTFKTLSFRGLTSQVPEKIADYPDEIVFVTTNGAAVAAQALFDKLERSPDSYAFLEIIY